MIKNALLISSGIIFTMLLMALAVPGVTAQDKELVVSLRRDWGYGGMGGQIQGRFTIKADGPEDLESVVFYIDEQVLAEVKEAPWRYQFSTDNYALGVHEMYAQGTTHDGQGLQSNVVTREFITAGQGWQTAAIIVIPLLLIAVAIPLLAYLRDRRSGKSTSQGYGAWGGAVCPKCGYPFARHLWAPNIGVGKYDRCPHCRKWSVVGKASIQALQSAEHAHGLVADSQASDHVDDISEEERLRKRLDDSRYEDA